MILKIIFPRQIVACNPNFLISCFLLKARDRHGKEYIGKEGKSACLRSYESTCTWCLNSEEEDEMESETVRLADLRKIPDYFSFRDGG